VHVLEQKCVFYCSWALSYGVGTTG